jgi:hypothetical protein
MQKKRSLMSRTLFCLVLLGILCITPTGCHLTLKKEKADLPQITAKKGKRFIFIPSCKNAFYQAQLSKGWNNRALKYISIDGNRYSSTIIMSYVTEPDNSSIFNLMADGTLVIAMGKQFDMEIAFYPPTKHGHKEFKQFQLVIIDRKNKVLYQQPIKNRMKKYKFLK